MPLQQYDERNLAQNYQRFIDSYTPGTWEVCSANLFSGDWRADIIRGTNSDSIAHNLAISIIGHTQSIIGSVLVPSRAGFDGNPPADFMAALLPATQAFLLIQNSVNIEVMCAEAINTGQIVDFYAFGGAF